MTASQPNLLELAKQGDATAIAALMNRHLQPKGVTATATLEDGCLQVALESQQVPNQPSLTEFIQKGVTNLGVDVIKRVRVYGVQTGKITPVWEQDILLKPYAAVPDLPPIEAPLPAAEEIVPSMPDMDVDVLNDGSGSSSEQKPGVGTFLSRHWKVIPMMVIAALIGFAAVVFILSRSQRSPDPVADSPTPAADPATASTSPVPTSPVPTSPAPTTASPAAPTGTPSPSPLVNAASPPPTTSIPASPGAIATSPATTASPTTAATPYQQALEVGYSAAVKTQDARTRSQWSAVVSEWQQAIELLGSVPSTNTNYATAQQKITEYQRNLSYAQRRLQETTAP
ncbi:MAG: hypothetical protein SFY66_08785 [Oculatellaceae cyanobacterium bins.114]|nr:hypothetical protein [Oculatellaceae cyanobacterium bins.114]